MTKLDSAKALVSVSHAGSEAWQMLHDLPFLFLQLLLPVIHIGTIGLISLLARLFCYDLPVSRPTQILRKS